MYAVTEITVTEMRRLKHEPFFSEWGGDVMAAKQMNIIFNNKVGSIFLQHCML